MEEPKRYHIDCILSKQRFNNSISDAKTLPRDDVHSDHNLGLYKECKKRLKPIKQAKWRKLKWNLEKKVKSKEIYMKEVIKQKLRQIDEFTGSLEDSWGNVIEILAIRK